MKLDFDSLLDQCPKELLTRIKNLKNVPQRQDHHPEGNVFEHTRIVVNRLLKYKDSILSWAGLFHDIGKDVTTKADDKGVLHAVDHEIVSAEVVRKYIRECKMSDTYYISDKDYFCNMVAEIVEMHMRIKLLDEMSLKKQLEMRRLPCFGYLQLFAIADDMSTLTEEEIKNPIKYPKRLVFEIGPEEKEFWDIQKKEIADGVEPAYFKVIANNPVGFLDVKTIRITEIGKDGVMDGKKCINFPVHIFNRLREEV